MKNVLKTKKVSLKLNKFWELLANVNKINMKIKLNCKNKLMNRITSIIDMKFTIKTSSSFKRRLIVKLGFNKVETKY